MNQSVLLSLVFLVIASCAPLKVGDEQLLEKVGDPSLKKAEQPSDLFIGISRPMPSEQEALEDAMINARLQIVRSLGVRIEVEFEEVIRQASEGDVIESDMTGQSRARMYAGNVLEVMSRASYYEKWVRVTPKGREVFFKAWVSVPFDSDQHKRMWLGFVRTVTGKIESKISRFTQAQPNMTAILELLDESGDLIGLEEDFSGQVWLSSTTEYRELLATKNRLLDLTASFLSDVRIKATPNRTRFPDRVAVEFLVGGAPLVNAPVFARSEALALKGVFRTGADGKVVIPVNITTTENVEILFSAGFGNLEPGNGADFPFQRLVLLSPLDRSNLRILVDISTDVEEPWFAIQLNDLLKGRGYSPRVGPDPNGDYDFVISGKFRSEQVTGRDRMQRIIARSTLDLRVIRTRDDTGIYSYHLPDETWKDTRGFGSTLLEARENSLTLANLPTRKDLLYTLITRIDMEIRNQFTRQ